MSDVRLYFGPYDSTVDNAAYSIRPHVVDSSNPAISVVRSDLNPNMVEVSVALRNAGASGTGDANVCLYIYKNGCGPRYPSLIVDNPAYHYPALPCPPSEPPAPPGWWGQSISGHTPLADQPLIRSVTTDLGAHAAITVVATVQSASSLYKKRDPSTALNRDPCVAVYSAAQIPLVASDSNAAARSLLMAQQDSVNENTSTAQHERVNLSFGAINIHPQSIKSRITAHAFDPGDKKDREELRRLLRSRSHRAFAEDYVRFRKPQVSLSKGYERLLLPQLRSCEFLTQDSRALVGCHIHVPQFGSPTVLDIHSPIIGRLRNGGAHFDLDLEPGQVQQMVLTIDSPSNAGTLCAVLIEQHDIANVDNEKCPHKLMQDPGGLIVLTGLERDFISDC